MDENTTMLYKKFSKRRKLFTLIEVGPLYFQLHCKAPVAVIVFAREQSRSHSRVDSKTIRYFRITLPKCLPFSSSAVSQKTALYVIINFCHSVVNFLAAQS
ncbi:hypothetical protein D918_01901 [Trichuris suis]|nr:hypothetical protein D918_01901 [Trichuris suis]